MALTRFKTLLLREWMQHRRGWLAVATLPALGILALFVSPLGRIEVDHPLPVTLFAAMAMGLTICIVAGLSWFVTMLQLPGLARRDQQDRSIEFWLSLPASHSEAIGATLLGHALIAPLLALGVGALFAPLMTTAAVVKWAGFGMLAQVEWGALFLASLIVLARLALGVLLMTLWLAPLLLLSMAASAWLKRLGMPLLLGVVLIGGLLLDKMYGNPVIWDLLTAQLWGSQEALFSEAGAAQVAGQIGQGAELIASLKDWALRDSLNALAGLASPHLLGGLAMAGLGFWLLVLRRQRSA